MIVATIYRQRIRLLAVSAAPAEHKPNPPGTKGQRSRCEHRNAAEAERLMLRRTASQRARPLVFGTVSNMRLSGMRTTMGEFPVGDPYQRKVAIPLRQAGRRPCCCLN
jgi:hypothetical protein